MNVTGEIYDEEPEEAESVSRVGIDAEIVPTWCRPSCAVSADESVGDMGITPMRWICFQSWMN